MLNQLEMSAVPTVKMEKKMDVFMIQEQIHTLLSNNLTILMSKYQSMIEM